MVKLLAPAQPGGSVDCRTGPVAVKNLLRPGKFFVIEAE